MDPGEVLHKVALFRDLDRRAIDELLPDVRQRAFARGEAIWNEGDRADALYVVAEGQAKSYRVSWDGCELIVQVNTSGTLLGEAGVFHASGVRRVNVSAMEPNHNVPPTVKERRDVA